MEQFCPERKLQDIKYEMRRKREIIFLEKEHETPSNVSLPEMYNAANAYESDKNITEQFMC